MGIYRFLEKPILDQHILEDGKKIENFVKSRTANNPSSTICWSRMEISWKNHSKRGKNSKNSCFCSILDQQLVEDGIL